MNAELLRCPVDDMSLEDATVDKALTISTLYFWDNLGAGFEEIVRVLKPDDVFVTTHYTGRALDAYEHTHYGYSKYSENEAVSVACDVGFSVELGTIMVDSAYYLVCRRN